MWNQWSAGPPPMPPPSTANPQPPLIGPVLPNPAAPTASDLTPLTSSGPESQSTTYPSSSGAPSYTPAQYAAMTPEQQYAVQQHWQQWQAYEQQYAQWHAQYGEQYKREMAAIHGAPPPTIRQYDATSVQASVANSFAYPPPIVSNAYQVPMAPAHAPPPPPPDDKMNVMGIKAPPQIYEQPPPPPPPPQQEEKHLNKSLSSHQFQNVPAAQRGNMQASQLIQVQENRWSQPPPPMQSQGSIRNVLAQNLSGQQDSQQQNPLNQQFNNNNQRGNQRDQQRDEQGRDNRQINRHNSEYRGRTRGRGGNNFENNRQQQFDSSEGRNHQLQSESLGQKSSRGSFNNRFDNYESHNKNMDQRSQQGIPGWNNSSHGIDNQTQQQNLQNQTSPIENSQNNIKINSGSVDEKAFDEQFRLWEEQFENWKKENANHPDRTMYMQYEREFEKTRIRLLERREQMRRRKMMELQQLMQQEPKHQKQERECLEKEIDQQKSDHEEVDLKEQDNISESKQVESSDMEQSEIEDTGLEASKKQTELITESSIKIESNDTNIFKNNEISDLFKTASGIPGLDLVGSKGDDKNANPFIGVLDSEIIDLDNEGPSRPAKLAATSCSSATLSRSTVQQAAIKPVIPNIGTRQPSFTISQTQKRKIPSLFDIVVEKPILSPENDNRDLIRDPSPAGSRSPKTDITSGVVDSRSRSISNDRDVLGSPGQRPLSQMSQRQQIIQTNSEGSHDLKIHHPFSNQELQQPANIPPEAADLAKALQDPNVMQLLTVALAQAQQAEGINQSGNLQQNQLLQQLQQLQPLIQMQQQERNSNHQPWNHSQTYRPQSWQSQSQNSNIKVTSNSNQNRNSWSSNPFNKNNDRLSLSREPGSNNESENNNNMQQRNPHNPFRRNVGGCGSDDNSGGNRNLIGDFEGPVGNGSFNNNNFQSLSGLFGVPVSAQQKRGGNFGGGGRFNDDRPHSNFGISAGFRNNPNNFGDRGGDDNDYYRPAQVFDYQNRSRADIIVPLAKVVDYGHRPSAVMSTNSFNRDNSEFVPVKTIDYGHASNSAQNENQFQQTNMRLKNKVNTSDEDQQSNQGWEQSKGQTQFIKTKSQAKKESQEQRKSREKEVDTETPDKLQNKRIPFQTKEQNRQNKQQEKRNPNKIITQINKVLDDKNNEATQSVENENVNELDDENLTQYPNNKWVLQNTDGRRRPGPPTKRGKRYSVRFQTKQKCPPQDADNECDEIEENFEEISDNEDLNDIHDIPPPSIQCKEKSRPLFPSVSDSVANASIIFPSMENNNTIPIDEILFNPGRLTRPKNIVIIIRGPPGSGKSHVAKLIKDKEVEMGGATPRLLSIDDYFMIENDYEEKCPKTGRKIPKKEILYEYEKEMEGTYMQYLIKSFKKTVTDHLFDFIIVDCCNHSLRTFNEFYNAARDGNFSPFIVDMICDADICLNQNIHNRKEDEIKDIIKNYQDCPGHYIKLDVSNLLENVVEMEDVSDLEDNFAADSEVLDLDEDDEPKDSKGGGFLKSKWDTDPTTENLARLDGTSKPISKRGTATLEEYLQIDGWELPSSTTNGKKRVRWADIEEKRAQDKMRAIGFVVGQTDWNRMMDPTSGSGALTKTKYIERLNKRR